jgi:glycosyltransferase involved in cell wall biosynthesis
MTERPHVLIVLENESFPWDRRVRQEAFSLAASGYRVTVVCPNSAREPDLTDFVEGVRVLRFPEPPQGSGAFGYVREYAFAFVRARRVLRRLRDEPFAAVIVCNPPDFLIHLVRGFRRRGAGLVFDLHDPSPELFEAMFGRRGLIHRVLVALERWAERTADVIMTVNEPCADLVRTRGGIDDRVSVLVTGPDPESFYPVEPRPDLRRGKSHLVVWIGRMSRKENLPLLLDAADELVNRHCRTDIGFALIGDGDVRDELLAEVERRGLADSVYLPGQMADNALREWLSTADLCVSLDRSSEMNDRSLMVKVLEYMAMAKPILQFPLAEMQRVCGTTTAYAAEEDPGDLARKICDLVDDPERRHRLGTAAHMRLLEQGLTWPQQVPILLDAVERASSLHGGPSMRASKNRRELQPD